MPCNTCTDEARCDRAGLCQDFRRAVPPAAFRPVHGGYPDAAARDCIAPHGCWWPQCSCEVARAGPRLVVSNERSKQ